jgi:GntR family transcriptional regulator
LGARLARYKELRDLLAGEIAAGVYSIGSRFPTDHELCRRFRVSRHTVREALRGLQDQGLLSRHAGLGTRVLARAPGLLYAHAVDSVAELFDYAVETRFEKRHEGGVVLRDGLADLLGRQNGERWLRLAGIRWRVGENVPLCWTEIFVAAPYFEIRSLEQGGGPIYATIEREFGVRLREVEQRISAVAMAPPMARLLAVEPYAPALLVRRRYVGADGEPFEISLSLHPGDRYVYMARLQSRGGG